MANKKARFVALVGLLSDSKHHDRSQIFFFFDDLAVFKISRSGDFHSDNNNNDDDDDDRHTNRLLYPLRMRAG